MRVATRTRLKPNRNSEFTPGTRRLQRRIRQTPPYKVIAVGLYNDQAASLDHTAAELQRAGYVKANRSFVVQALIRKLQLEIEGLSSDQLLQMFFDEYVKRPLSKSSQREQPRPDRDATVNPPAIHRRKTG